MKHIYYKSIATLIFLCCSYTLFSQNVGINTTSANPSINAILDLNTGNKYNLGLIIPHVTLGASLTTFSPPIANGATIKDTGMMVYNMNGAQAVGYYYWNGTNWASVGGSGGGGGGGVNACVLATAGYLTYFTSSSTICNSVLYQLTPTTVGVGTITPKNMLDVNGGMAVGTYAGANVAPNNGMIVSGQVGIGNNAPASSAILDLTNTNASGGTGAPFLWCTNPSPATNITSPVLGEEIYNTTTGCFNFYNGSSWVTMECPCMTAPAVATITPGCAAAFGGNSITYTSSITTGVTFAWTVTATNGTPIVTGNGTSSITVTWPSGTGTGTVTLNLSNTCGTTPSVLPVTINGITGTTPISINTIGNTYSVSLAGATSYAWSFISNTDGSTITSPTNAQTVSVTAGSTAGSFTLQCVVTVGSCVNTITYNVTVNTCSGIITLDKYVQGGNNVSTLNITTATANEIVLVTVSGANGGSAFSPAVTVNGGSPTTTQLINTNLTVIAGATNSSVYGFVAATASTYTIVVTETGYTNYNNYAIALEGFCNTATLAANVQTPAPTVTSVASGLFTPISAISNAITTTTANSYIVANYSNFAYANTSPTMSWSAPVGIVNFTPNTYNGISGGDPGMEASTAGYADAGIGSVTFTVSDPANIAGAILQCVDVHN